MTITLRHLRILSAVAGNRSLTLAAKQLGLSQPSLSQQLSKLERSIGQRLVDRSAKGLHLTDAGSFLLGKAETILSMVEEAKVGLGQFEQGTRGEITVGAVASLARGLIPLTSIELNRRYPELRLNVVEFSPQVIVRQLQRRQIQIALVSSATLDCQNLPFAKVDLMEDRYVLAAPKGSMTGVNQRRLLSRKLPIRSVIMSDFGYPCQELIRGWYCRVMPGYREVARCRTFELALSMVETGLGVTIVPALATEVNGRVVFDVDLFSVPIGRSRVMGITPSQYRYTQPHALVLETLMAVAERRSATAAMPVSLLMADGNVKAPLPIET